MAKQKENAVVHSQEQLADGIYSMWINTEAAKDAKPGQFISVYTKDGAKLLPRPISICETNKETGMLRADLICFADETFNTREDLLLFDPNATWKKTLLPGGTYTMRELLVPIFQHGECKYESPSVKEIAEFCRQEKETLWDETKRLFNPHKVYVDLSQKLYDTKTKLLNEAHH